MQSPAGELRRSPTSCPGTGTSSQNGAKTLAKAEQWFAARGVRTRLPSCSVAGSGRHGRRRRPAAGRAQQRQRVGSREGGTSRATVPLRRARLPRGVPRCRCDPRRMGRDRRTVRRLGLARTRRARRRGRPWRTRSDDGDRRGQDTLGPASAAWSTSRTPSGSSWAAGSGCGSRRLGPRIEAAARASSLDRPGSQFTVLPATFGGDTVAVGVGRCCLSNASSMPTNPTFPTRPARRPWSARSRCCKRPAGGSAGRAPDLVMARGVPRVRCPDHVAGPAAGATNGGGGRPTRCRRRRDPEGVG